MANLATPTDAATLKEAVDQTVVSSLYAPDMRQRYLCNSGRIRSTGQAAREREIFSDEDESSSHSPDTELPDNSKGKSNIETKQAAKYECVTIEDIPARSRSATTSVQQATAISVTKPKAKRRRTLVAQQLLEPVQLSKEFELKQRFRVPDAIKICWNHPRQYMLDLLPSDPAKSNGDKSMKLCLLCLEDGSDKRIFSADSGNMMKHHKKVHLNKKVTFERIVELKGKIAHITDEDEPSSKVDPLDSFFQREAEGDYAAWLKATAKMVISAGLPLDFVMNPYFRIQNSLTQRLPLSITPSASNDNLSQKIMDLLDQYWTEFRNDVQSDQVCGWSLAFDGWDWGKKYKILGCTALIISVAPAGLTCQRYPLIFRRLAGNKLEDREAVTDSEEEDSENSESEYELFQTIQSAKDMAAVVRTQLEKRGIPFDKFVGATSGGAPNARNCSTKLNQHANALRKLEALSAEFDSRENRGVVHCLGLAIEGTLGFMNLKKGTIDADAPKPPSSEFEDLLKRVRSAVAIVNEAKTWVNLQDLAKINRLPQPKAVDSDMDVRWLSTFHMIRGFNNLLPLFKIWYASLDKGVKLKKLRFQDQDVCALQQIECVLQPLMDATRFLETSKTSVTSYALLVLSAILMKYGVDVHKVGICDFTIPEIAFKPIKNLVFKMQDGSMKKVEDMEDVVGNFVQTLREHLYYRLVAARTNTNLVEMLSMMVDPVGQVFVEFVFGESFDSMEAKLQIVARKLVIPVGNALRNEMQTKTDLIEKEGYEEELDCARPLSLKRFEVSPRTESEEEVAFDKEWREFRGHAFGLVKELQNGLILFSLDRVLKLYTELGPFTFWTAKRQEDFPKIFKVAKFVAPFVSHSCMQESVFSSAVATLTDRRKNLMQSENSAALLEALVLLRYDLNSKIRGNSVGVL